MNLQNRKLTEIRQSGETYILSVAMEKAFLEKWESYEFVLSQNGITENVEIPHTVIEDTEQYLIYELQITESKLNTFEEAGAILPMIVMTEGEEEKRVTIKSNNDYIELLQIHLGDGLILHPFTTKNNNIAFKTEEERLFARIDHAEINEDDELELYGLYHFSDLVSEDIKRLEIVAIENKTKTEYVFPATLTSLPDLYEGKIWSAKVMDNGFYTSISLKTFVQTARSGSFSFILKVVLKESGEQAVLESRRITMNVNNINGQSRRRYKYADTTFTITCKPTKQRKFLSVKASYYKPVKRRIGKARKKVVQVVRSKRMQKIYQLAFKVMAKVNPVNRKLVIFESFHGKQYSDNPRAIYEYMTRSTRGYKLIWSADRRHMEKFIEAGVPYVRRFSIKWLFLMTSAGHWVTNARLPLWIPKPKHTTYVQTWHGTPLKRLAADMEEVHMPGTDTERYKRNFTSEAAKWDYLVSPNGYSTEIFRRAFQFDKEVLETGYPRNDYLYDANDEWTIGRIKRRIGIKSDKKVILYAPTWRDNQFYRKGAYKFDLQMDLDDLQREFGDTHVIVLRMHYLVAENLDISAYEGFVYDCSTYDDIRDLYLISDILITDYSSVFFDFANLRRPMIFFVYDIDEYRDTLRGFYFDFEEKAPGPLVKDTEGLIQEVKKIEQDGFQPADNYDEFIDKFCYLEDGRASERVVKALFDN
ncbi:CDP-glycerol glycerophosphotransferase family protein [Aciduricibacillus chroicocephali]|uniref:CDP-glycerol glycerophosphotransferase family protein n=1 Tax=Aciduricibacillus chroicocephali TaxID=3054939 RepID=A0ABY9KTX4_9BACI|nr:CDP-glycerol glycerophosphotransferase family protein [Bacillaceae bacterium 44XB]